MLFGVSTSSYQIEEDCDDSNWSREHPEHKNGIRHRENFEQDFVFLKNLGINSYRFSIEWSKISPERGVLMAKGLDFYERLIDRCLENNILPIVCLWHFTIPCWFQDIGGFLKKENTRYFTEYVDFVFQRLGEKVTHWVVMNEPNIYAMCSYLLGVWTPYTANLVNFFTVNKNLLECYQVCYQRHTSRTNTIGVILNLIDFDRSIFVFYPFIYIYNYFLYNLNRNIIDFIGINYYFRYSFTWKDLWYVYRGDQFFDRYIGSESHSDLGWPIDDGTGLVNVLRYIHTRWRDLPIVITENGIADRGDTKRQKYLKSHLDVVMKHREEYNIVGYFVWSLFDNIEWEYGISPRFGLVEIDYENRFARKKRESYDVYRRYIRSMTKIKTE